MIAPTANVDAARAVGRCWGALFFSVFGGAWFLLAAYAFGRLNPLDAGLIAIGVILFVLLALRLQRRGQDAGKDAFPEEERRRNGRVFGIVNAITWIAVFLAFQIFPRVGHPDLAIPAVVLLVGLHFFPLPPLYRHRANLVTGGCLVLWAILCPLLFRGGTMIGFAAAGAGLVLWASAAWALRTANCLGRLGSERPRWLLAASQPALILPR
ncbi:MAG: hypothetical protein ABSG13_11600 [Bryobacteraceae bacterium]|jgi:hypothetical protein